jgi:alpha-N-arabinofuranosidase
LPTRVGRRQQHLGCTATTLLDFVPAREGEEAGLTVYRSHEHRYEIAVGRSNGRRRVFVRQTIGPSLQAVTASAPIESLEPVVLRVEAKPEAYAFSFGLGETPKEWTPLGTAPTRFLSTEVASGFTGAFLALYATGNGQPAESPARFDWFDYEPRPE